MSYIFDRHPRTTMQTSHLRLFSLIALFLLWGCAKKTIPQQDKPVADKTTPSEDVYLVPIEEEVRTEGQERAEAPLWVQEPGDYNPEQPRPFRLHHTKLELRPEWDTQHIIGRATLTLQPWFYAQSEVVLDAKGFEIKKVVWLDGNTKKPLEYDYDQQFLRIAFPKPISREQKVNVRIDYVAKPNELMRDDMPFFVEEQGLYFINPEGKTPGKPRQIWTQGETENNSCWFPTFDQPNVKTTQDVLITVADNFQTLSNGKRIRSRQNADGTRTDHWRQEKPHAPYLFMLAVGEFAVVEEEWRGKPVSYYVEPEYREHAKAIFGRTPDMLTFFSERFGYEYPWAKYAQVAVRDYTSGAMENTSATIHMAEVQRTKQELKDYNWDDLIAHELAHHWFGNLVTCESWANLPLNESFATYSEFLWTEHAEGTDAAHFWWQEEMNQYLYEAQLKREPLIRYRYQDREDMFDSHSYAKGALLLHLLRQQAGDAAFFESLKRFLNRYAFGKAEIHDLRLIFEEVTGYDWKRFFDQYFLEAGHPEIGVYEVYQDGQLEVTASQVQPEDYSPTYHLPLSIQIWSEGVSQTHRVVLDERQKTFTFSLPKKPDAVIFDAEHEVIGTIEHDKPVSALLVQLHKPRDYRTRVAALEKLSPKVGSAPEVNRAFRELLNADFWALRRNAAKAFMRYPDSLGDYTEVVTQLKQLAKEDPESRVRMAAVDVLASLSTVPDAFFEEKVQDSSFFVKRSALFALSIRLGPLALPYLEAHEDEENNEIVMLLGDFYSTFGIPGKLDWFIRKMDKRSGDRLGYLMDYFATYLPALSDTEKRRAADYLVRQAEENSYFKTRKEAFQHLLILEDVEGVEEDIERLKKTEKDRRVADFQQVMDG